MDYLSEINILPLEDIKKAAMLAPEAIKNTPLIKLHQCTYKDKEIYLKLENLQEVGSFKVRGAYNAIVNNDVNHLRKHGVFSSSAGNFAQGLAWASKTLNIPCTIVCPESTPQVKLSGIRMWEADVIKTPFNQWWDVMTTGQYDNLKSVFIHPCCDPHVMAGNGVIGLEILNQLPDVDTIICSYGGGGHSLGIASAVKSIKECVNIYACEVETASPLADSFDAGKAVAVKNFKKSFVDGMNGPSMFPCMWKLAKNLISKSIVLTEKDICDALRSILIKNRLLCEGAGAATVAAASKEEIPPGKIVCVISGGNIDIDILKEILEGNVPQV